MDFVTRHTQDLDDEGEITNGSNFLIILGQTVPVELTDPRGIRVQFDLPHETMKRYYAQFQTEVPHFKPGTQSVKDDDVRLRFSRPYRLLGKAVLDCGHFARRGVKHLHFFFNF